MSVCTPWFNCKKMCSLVQCVDVGRKGRGTLVVQSRVSLSSLSKENSSEAGLFCGKGAELKPEAEIELGSSTANFGH